MAKKKNVRKKKQKKGDFLPLILVASGVVLVLLMVFILSRNTAGTSTAAAGEISQDDIARVSSQEAKAAQDAGTAVIVDVRDSDSFASSHAAGSINIPWDQIEERLSELDKDKWIIPYCT